MLQPKDQSRRLYKEKYIRYVISETFKRFGSVFTKINKIADDERMVKHGGHHVLSSSPNPLPSSKVKDTECSGSFPFSNRPAVSSPVASQENKRKSFRARHLKVSVYIFTWCVPPPSLELVHSLGDPMLSRSSVFSSGE
ncbi:hypothetical protein YC2023_027147 [Brassica napus]|uniref:(rape) hypothetical protein n=1 Tax=Brassica napus TaxID=3708 RepID=A0A816V781_BRANA|nr:unnamed protein product [Brassica napus]